MTHEPLDRVLFRGDLVPLDVMLDTLRREEDEERERKSAGLFTATRASTIRA